MTVQTVVDYAVTAIVVAVVAVAVVPIAASES